MIEALLSENDFVHIEGNAVDSGIEDINCLYVINLNQRPKRWEHIQMLCAHYDLHPTRVNAVNGWNLSPEVLHRIRSPIRVGKKIKKLNGGQIGCFLSHLSVYRDAIKRGYARVWIIEDDILILQNPQILSSLIATLETIDPVWDILYTDKDTRNSEGEEVSFPVAEIAWNNPYMKLRGNSRLTKREKISANLITSGFRFGMYSAIFSRRGLIKAYHNLATLPLWTPLDHCIHYIPNIREYSAIEPIVTVRVQKDVSDTIYRVIPE